MKLNEIGKLIFEIKAGQHGVTNLLTIAGLLDIPVDELRSFLFDNGLLKLHDQPVDGVTSSDIIHSLTLWGTLRLSRSVQPLINLAAENKISAAKTD